MNDDKCKYVKYVEVKQIGSAARVYIVFWNLFYLLCFFFFLGDNKQMSPLQTARKTKMKNDDRARPEMIQVLSNDVMRQERLGQDQQVFDNTTFDDGEVIDRS